MTDNEDPARVLRRSISDRLAERATDTAAIVVTAPAQFDVESTSTFRIGVTGELTVDQAASIPSVPATTSLGDIDVRVASAHHLLALPNDVVADEVEALSISVWDESGWTDPGILHLTEGATLEGPWTLPQDLVSSLGFSSEITQGWLLRAAPDRVAPLSPDLPADEWSRAFPQGLPSGTELKALLVLRRIARRLGGELRIAGSGYIIDPDQESAVTLRVFSPECIDYEAAGDALRGQGMAAKLPVGSPVPLPGAPYALTVQAADGPQVLMGVTLVREVPRVLRWEEWSVGPVWLYELTWPEGTFLNPERMSRKDRLSRRRAGQTIERLAAVLAQNLGPCAIIDEDDFLVDRDELLQVVARPHL